MIEKITNFNEKLDKEMSDLEDFLMEKEKKGEDLTKSLISFSNFL